MFFDRLSRKLEELKYLVEGKVKMFGWYKRSITIDSLAIYSIISLLHENGSLKIVAADDGGVDAKGVHTEFPSFLNIALTTV